MERSLVYLSNRPIGHMHNSLAEKVFCLCQMYAVLYYFLRTESRTGSNRAGNGAIFGYPLGGWNTQNGAERRVLGGNGREEKAD